MARKGFYSFVFCVLPFVLSSCGYVGDPLPPALHIPNRIQDLRAWQRADSVILNFTVPQLTTEGLGLRLGAVELQAGTWGNEPFNAGQWEARARREQLHCSETGPCSAALAAGEWFNREVFFRVRAVSGQGRAGDWSDFSILPVRTPLEPPGMLRAEAVAQGVRLSWQPSGDEAGVSFRVRRRAGGEQTASAVADVTDHTWTDPATEYGTRYEYTVQAVGKAGKSEAVSEISPPVEITPADRFAPAVPGGLTALAATQSVELSWDRNTEPDFSGYYLYRATGDEPFRRIADLLTTPSYGDRAVEAGKTYRYAVSAADRLGNESERSKPVEITVP